MTERVTAHRRPSERHRQVVRSDEASDWSAEVDMRLRAQISALLETHDMRYWHQVLAVIHPWVVRFAEATLRRTSRRHGRLTSCRPGRPSVTQRHEQALDVAVMVCADLRKDGYRRLAAFRGLKEDSGAPLRGYVAEITRRAAFRYLRNRVLRPDGGRREITSHAQSAGLPTLERVPASRQFDTRTRTAMHVVARERDLQLLTPLQRDVLERYLRGYTAAEIAEHYGPPVDDPATARQLIRSAKAKLKYHFGREEKNG